MSEYAASIAREYDRAKWYENHCVTMLMEYPCEDFWCDWIDAFQRMKALQRQYTRHFGNTPLDSLRLYK